VSEVPRTQKYGPVIAAGLAGALAAAALVGWLRPPQVRQPSEKELRRIHDEIARIGSDLSAGSVTRELTEALAAEAERLYEELDRVYEDSFIDTAAGRALDELRVYDRELARLTVEIRCRLAEA
jgi:cob(I)alamin adenosyltransferase